VARHGARWDGLQQVPLADLAAEPFVFYGESLALNDVVLSACRVAGFAPTIVGRSGHWDFMAALVLAGVGIALLPAPYCRRLDSTQFTCLPVVEPEIPWEMAIGWRRNGYLSHAARAWLEVARETLPSQAGDDLMHWPDIGITGLASGAVASGTPSPGADASAPSAPAPAVTTPVRSPKPSPR
jgi:DNA-binding transcriptional LysR family regulator